MAERTLELTVPEAGRILWRFQDRAAAVRLAAMTPLMAPAAPRPDLPAAAEVTVRSAPFRPPEELPWRPEGIIRLSNKLSAWMPAPDRVEILLHPAAENDPEGFSLQLQRIVWYGFIPLILRRKAVVFHGALLARNGGGVILCGPSGAGKSTCARRVPPPWQALADDAVLVTATKDGYAAQGLPTWSQLRTSKPIIPVDLNAAVSLTGIYRIAKASLDAIVEVPALEKLYILLHQFSDFRHVWSPRYLNAFFRPLNQRATEFASRLVRKLPVSELRCTLDGSFWTELDASPLPRPAAG